MTTYVPPCWQQSEPYDILIDSDKDVPRTRWAAVEAANLCQDCRIRTECLTVENKDEHWAQTVRAVLAYRAKQRLDGAA